MKIQNIAVIAVIIAIITSVTGCKPKTAGVGPTREQELAAENDRLKNENLLLKATPTPVPATTPVVAEKAEVLPPNKIEMEVKFHDIPDGHFKAKLGVIPPLKLKKVSGLKIQNEETGKAYFASATILVAPNGGILKNSPLPPPFNKDASWKSVKISDKGGTDWCQTYVRDEVRMVEIPQ